MDAITEIPKLAKEDKLFIGKDLTLKNLKTGKVKKVFLSSNCPVETIEDIKHYAELAKVDTEILDIPNDEIGVLCKKLFSISVLGLRS